MGAPEAGSTARHCETIGPRGVGAVGGGCGVGDGAEGARHEELCMAFGGAPVFVCIRATQRAKRFASAFEARSLAKKLLNLG
jgi:hypothetical protein